MASQNLISESKTPFFFLWGPIENRHLASNWSAIRLLWFWNWEWSHSLRTVIVCEGRKCMEFYSPELAGNVRSHVTPSRKCSHWNLQENWKMFPIVRLNTAKSSIYAYAKSSSSKWNTLRTFLRTERKGKFETFSDAGERVCLHEIDRP